jgi:hypothetical protein
MPVTYEIDSERHLIYTRCLGPVTLPDVLEHFATLVQDPERPDQMDVLLDLTETTSFPTTDQLRAVSLEIGRIRPQVQFGRCAIVTSNQAWFGLARMFEVFAINYFHATDVFRTVGEAAIWLESPTGNQSA